MEELVHQFGYGDLQHHYSKCDSCGGTGCSCDDDEEECEKCEGDGKIRWGSYYNEDTGKCDICQIDEISITERLFDGVWTCLPCYIKIHQKECGCDLFGEAEKLLTVLIVTLI